MKEALAFLNVKPYIDLFREICIGKKLQTNLLHLHRPEERIALILCQKRFTGRNFFSASNEFQKNLFANIPSLNNKKYRTELYSNRHDDIITLKDKLEQINME